MAPTDREFDALTKRLAGIEDKLDALREEMAVRRGVDAVLRWMAGGGGVVGFIGGLLAIIQHLKKGTM